MAATVVRLVVVLGLCHAAIALATDAGGWHMTGGDASRSYSGPAGTPPPVHKYDFVIIIKIATKMIYCAGARSALWAHPYAKASGQDVLYGLGRAGLSSPQHIVGPTGGICSSCAHLSLSVDR